MIEKVNKRVLNVLNKYNNKEMQKKYLTKETAFSRENDI